MKALQIPSVVWLAVAVIGGALVYVSIKGAKGAGQAIGSAAVDMVDGVVSGTVEGIGSFAGIPKTNMSECERARAEGRTWDASFACPAKDFLKHVFS
ncbi:hypothetical protein [Lacisediminimonas profundi]|uniref:hypothetical protein n=1 Tax=Lacisediminimonas profundi TaxID=2603856 RepID=UPI00124B0DFA|nr:hypothetical protein [Lacisediminimonas profundi]